MTRNTRSLLDDPVAFAEELYSGIVTCEDPRMCAHAPREYAAFKAAFHALRAVLATDIPHDHPAHLMDEEAHAWAGAVFFDGIRFGLAADQLRRSMVAMHDVAPCPTCWGRGMVRGERCAECEGDGFAALATPRR